MTSSETPGEWSAPPPEEMYNYLPFYLVIDVSGSMEGAPIGAINAELPRLQRSLVATPIVAEVARLAIVSFSDSPRVDLPLSDLADVDRMPALAAGGGTSYRSVFEYLKPLIDSDYRAMKAAGWRSYRPTVFFLTDGKPTDLPERPWGPAYEALVNPHWPLHPNVLAFGFGAADVAVLQEIGKMASRLGSGNVAAYMATSGQVPATMLQDLVQFLTSSIVTSARSLGTGAISVAAPEPGPGSGFVRLDVLP
jgi:uncharacterized protein YegL